MSVIDVENVDLRVRKTRMYIERALIELLGERSFDEITVNAIADKAMVNRATFYDHFADKYALLEYIAEKQFRELLEKNGPAEDSSCHEYIEALIVATCQFLSHLDNHCSPVAARRFPPMDAHISAIMINTLAPMFASREPRSAELKPELVAEVICGAVYSAARYWSKQVNRPHVRVFARSVAPLISAIAEESYVLP